VSRSEARLGPQRGAAQREGGAHVKLSVEGRSRGTTQTLSALPRQWEGKSRPRIAQKCRGSESAGPRQGAPFSPFYPFTSQPEAENAQSRAIAFLFYKLAAPDCMRNAPPLSTFLQDKDLVSKTMYLSFMQAQTPLINSTVLTPDRAH